MSRARGLHQGDIEMTDEAFARVRIDALLDPQGTQWFFYRTSVGAELEMLLELPTRQR